MQTFCTGSLGPPRPRPQLLRVSMAEASVKGRGHAVLPRAHENKRAEHGLRDARPAFRVPSPSHPGEHESGLPDCEGETPFPACEPQDAKP